MTGSGSRSHTGRRYWYYQCQHSCRERFRADRAHEALDRYLQSLEIAPEVAALYSRIQDPERGAHAGAPAAGCA